MCMIDSLIDPGVVYGGSGKHQDQLSEQQILNYWKVSFLTIRVPAGMHIYEILSKFKLRLSNNTFPVDIRAHRYLAYNPDSHQNIHFAVLRTTVRDQSFSDCGLHSHGDCMSVVL